MGFHGPDFPNPMDILWAGVVFGVLLAAVVGTAVWYFFFQ
jgi:hypothetical protein